MAIETLPVPNEKSIYFREIGPEKIAAIRFSGYFQQKNIDKNIDIMQNTLQMKK